MESTYCPITRCYTDVYDANGKLVHGCIACDPHSGKCIVWVDEKYNGERVAMWTYQGITHNPSPLTTDR